MSIGLYDLIGAFRLLGLQAPRHTSLDISVAHVEQKLTNPSLAKALGGLEAVPLIELTERCANLLDSFSESGEWKYVLAAQAFYNKMLNKLEPNQRAELATVAAAIFNYFSFERMIVDRIRHHDRFVRDELAEYLLRRGSDAIMYASLLRLCDHVQHPSLVTGFRIRQALYDLADDLEDVEQDRRTIGANLLLLTTAPKRELRRLADSLHRSVIRRLEELPSLHHAIECEYERVCSLL